VKSAGGDSDSSEFVVQRGKSVPTLSSVASLRNVGGSSESGAEAKDAGAGSLEKHRKEQQNQDTKSEERGEEVVSSASAENDEGPPSLLERLKLIPVAGKPSDAPIRHSVYARPAAAADGGDTAAAAAAAASGTTAAAAASLSAAGSSSSGGAAAIGRSRRNSVDDNASQLSVENLGGSQDNLSLLGRNPDKEMRTHTGRKLDHRAAATAAAASANVHDMNNYIDNRELDAMENSVAKEVSVAGTSSSGGGGHGKVSFADLRRQKARDQFHTSGININYMENEKEDLTKAKVAAAISAATSGLPSTSSAAAVGLHRRPSDNNNGNPYGASNTTSWGQQPSNNNQDVPGVDEMSAQLNGVRMKLEQRRKRIEEEKRKMEQVMDRQREKDLGEDISALQTRWLSTATGSKAGGATAAASHMAPHLASEASASTPRTPDVDGLDRDTYTQSLQAMNDSLHDLQSDIHRLAQQHSQIQQMMHTPATAAAAAPQVSAAAAGRPMSAPHPHHNPLDPQPFYISADSPQQPVPPSPAGSGGPPHTPQRRTWGQPQPISFAQQGGGMMSVDPSGWGGQQPRQRWGGPPPPPPHQQQQQHPRMYQPQQQSPYYGATDPYGNPGSPMRDQWGNVVQQQPPHPYYQNDPNYPYNNAPQQQPGYSPQHYPGAPGAAPPANGGYPQAAAQGQYGTPPSHMSQQQPPPAPPSVGRPSANSFRLHDSASPAAGLQRPLVTSSPSGAGSVAGSSVYSPSTSAAAVAAAVAAAASSSSAVPARQSVSARRRISESDTPTSPGIRDVPPSFSRQSSRGDSVGREMSPTSTAGMPTTNNNSSSPPRRLHTSVPAPEEMDMEPQNVSFIEASSADEDSQSNKTLVGAASASSGGGGPRSPTALSGTSSANLSDRLSRLNISSGSKTYRVLSDDKDSSPSPTRSSGRPTISAAFKQSRKGSGGSGGEGSGGPSSLRSNSGRLDLTEEEQETLTTMKTERLKEDADASKGFVISFDDDDKPKKPKPELKNSRRLSLKKNSVASASAAAAHHAAEMSSDGSNSSRKENVPPTHGGGGGPPPGVMICIDMNTGNESSEGDFRGGHGGPPVGGGGGSGPSSGGRGGSPQRKYSAGMRNGGSPTRDGSHWRSYEAGNDNAAVGGSVIPKFDVDPSVPLEEMAALGGAATTTTATTTQTSESESDGSGGGVNHHKMTTGLIIGEDLLRADPSTQDEMQRKKERIMMQSLRRKQQAEENRIRQEEETRKKRELEAKREEEKARKKEEEKARKEAILEQFRLKKEMEKAEEEGLIMPGGHHERMPEPVSARPVPRMRPKSTSKTQIGGGGPPGPRQRPKTIHVDQDADINDSFVGSGSRVGPRGSSSNLSGLHRSESRNSVASNYDRPPHHGGGGGGGGGLSIAGMGTNRNRGISGGGPSPSGSGVRPTSRGPPSRRGSVTHLNHQDDHHTVGDHGGGSGAHGGHSGTRLSSNRFRGSRESLQSGMTYSARRGSNASMYNDNDYYYGGSMRDINAGPARPRKSSSVSHLGPGSLPGYRRRGPGGEYCDDGASDISSTSGFSAFGYRSGTRLYREPASKSNRTIILNAIEYVVFPGVVNADTRNRVLDVIDRCDCPHFLLLFRDAKCQFRGLYAYYPDTEEVYKIYGTGPKQVTYNMYDNFFKYNSGGKKFTKIHTKSLTVTIDAFTIHNALWLGKKPKLPDKRDMALVV